MKRVLLIIGAVLLLIGTGLGTYFVTTHFHNKETEQLSSQIATLNARLNEIGTITECYTVLTTTYPGQEFTEDMLVVQNIPEKMTNDSFSSINQIVGGYSKVVISPGTPITADMVMQDTITDSLREIDLTASRWPIGLQVGDYIDLRVVFAYGEDFIVLSHKRVQSIEEDCLKINVTEEEIALWQAAVVDWYINKDEGADLYFVKYVEPGLQQPAEVFYSVNPHVAAACMLDPNITNRAMVALNESMRNVVINSFDKDPFSREDWRELVAAGRDELNEAVMGDYEEWRENYNEYLNNQQGTGSDPASDSLVQQITEGEVE